MNKSGFCSLFTSNTYCHSPSYIQELRLADYQAGRNKGVQGMATGMGTGTGLGNKLGGGLFNQGQQAGTGGGGLFSQNKLGKLLSHTLNLSLLIIHITDI